MTDKKLEIELADEDILDAMRHFEGYIDVFADDFRVIYHHAHRHAIQRLTQRLSAATLMRQEVPTLAPETMLDAAARVIAQSGYKGLPVVDTNARVIGMLTETDFLRLFQVGTLLELLLKMMADKDAIDLRCHEISVRTAMTTSVVTVPVSAGLGDIMRCFQAHAGRSMPVTDSDGRLQGLLLRKDLAAHLGRLS